MDMEFMQRIITILILTVRIPAEFQIGIAFKNIECMLISAYLIFPFIKSLEICPFPLSFLAESKVGILCMDTKSILKVAY